MASTDAAVADVSMKDSSLNSSAGKKRKHADDDNDYEMATQVLRQPSLPPFNLTGSSLKTSANGDKDSSGGGGWQVVDRHSKKKQKRIPKTDSNNYPAIQFSKDCRLQSQIRISDLQNLALYILADGPSPQFVSVRHRNEIRKVVVLMVPGLEMSMFLKQDKDNSSRERDNGHHNYSSPDGFYPTRLVKDELPEPLKPFADMFQHIWPVKTPGDEKYSKMHSPLHAMLTAPTTRSQEEKKTNKNKKGAKPVQEPHGWKNTRVPISEFTLSMEELEQNEYIVHPAWFEDEVKKAAYAEHRRTTSVSEEHGWVDTLVKDLSEGTPPDNEIEAGSITAGREILAMDCEMCVTGVQESSLTRISIIRWDGEEIMDELVKPAKPIINYVTQYSGITKEMLAPVTTTLQDIQKKLLSIFTPRTILLGHSLNSDLNALKITHPYIIDTAILYPHPRGPPLKSSLKWLAQRYLSREIQKGHGTTGPGAGHDPREDARTCLDLLKQKCEKGKEWGTSDAQGENIFKRVARTGTRYKNQGGSAVAVGDTGGRSSAAIDWGEPKKGPGSAASFVVGCHSDEEIKNGVIRAVKGDPIGEEIPAGGVDFVWARFRELEALKGWWNDNRSPKALAPLQEAENAKTRPEETSGSKKRVNPFSESSNPFSFDGNPFAINNPFLPKPENAVKGELKEEVKELLQEQAEAEAKEETKKEAEEAKKEAEEEAEEEVKEEPIIQDPIPTGTDTSMTNAAISSITTIPQTLSEATTSLAHRIHEIYKSLPPCTAFIVYSGSGDPREMSRLQSMQTTFKREYKVKKWDELSVKWTDVEEQALKKAARDARDGIGFVACK